MAGIKYYPTVEENFVNYYKCNHLDVGELNKSIFSRHKWSRSKNKKDPTLDLYIPCGYTYSERELSSLHPSNATQTIYSIPGCDHIVSKNRLWDLLVEKWGRKKASEIMPQSFSLNNYQERSLLRKYWAKHANRNGEGPIMILKKNVQQKKGLLLTRSWSDIRFARFKGYVVAQTYQTDIYKIKGRKINLRVYLALKCHKGKLEA